MDDIEVILKKTDGITSTTRLNDMPWRYSANKSAESERMTVVFPGVATVKNSPE
jgi:hypothetical protein